MTNSIYPILDLTAGLDEVGRGALVGNIVVGAVILNKNNFIYGLKDSKKLSHSKRIIISKEIRKKAISWSIGCVNEREIDLLNSSQATLLAMKRAVLNLNIKPNYIFIDGNERPDITISSLPIIKGDNILPVISAASIIAKVYRDKEMLFLHKIFPEYEFNKNKGYPTFNHLKSLKKYGATNFHRYSFTPVTNVLSKKIIYRI